MFKKLVSVLCFCGLTVSICFAQIPIDPPLRKLERIERKEVRTEKRQLRKVFSGEIQLSGAFALYPLVVKWAEEFNKLYPRVKIDISAGGAGKGITDALSKVVDLGMVSRKVYSAELSQGAFVITVARDAVVPTVNSNNPLAIDILNRGLTLRAAKRLWVNNNITKWGEILGTSSHVPVHVYTRSDACGAAETWGAWLGCRQEDLEGTAVFGDPGVASVVQRDRVGIGFNNLAYAYDLRTKKPHRGIMVIPIDVDGNGRVDLDESFYGTITDLNAAIADGRYPSPPARELYLVSSGVPSKPEVIAFLQYILTEGQKYAPEVGFIPLSEEKAEEQMLKLD